MTGRFKTALLIFLLLCSSVHAQSLQNSKDQKSLDDSQIFLRVRDFSAGQWSYPHPTDDVIMPNNGASELLDTSIEKVGQWSKRNGYSQIADDLGDSPIDGLVAYNVPGGDRLLVTESNGTIYTWTGTGNWTSSKTGLTDVSDWSDLVVANDLLFRLSKTENAESFDGSTWTDEGNTSTDVPRGKFGIWTSGQNFLVANTTANPNFVYASDAGDPQTFDQTSNAFAIGIQDTDGVTCMTEFTDNDVIVFTRSEMDLLNTADATIANWTRAKVADVGCEAHRTLRLVGEDALFLSRDGVRSVVQSAQDKKRGASLPLSFPIQDWIDRINWQYVDQAIAWVWQDKYYLSVPLDTSTTNSYTFVWSRRAFEANDKKGGWTIYTNWASNAYATQAFTTTPKMYFGEASSDSLVYFARSATPSDEPTTDDGTNITFKTTSPRYSFNFPELDKRFEVIEVEATVQSSGTLTIEAQVDGEGYSTIGTCDLSSGAPTLSLTLPFTLVPTANKRCKYSLQPPGRGRDIQVRFTESTSASVDILGFTIAAYLENFEYE